MERLQYPLSHEWHVAVNKHSDEWRKADKEWGDMRFMYEAKSMADEVPRMVMLFRQERENALPQTHQQCSMQAPVPVKDNHLTCCKGVKTRECPHLLALEKIARCTPADVDTAKPWRRCRATSRCTLPSRWTAAAAAQTPSSGTRWNAGSRTSRARAAWP